MNLDKMLIDDQDFSVRVQNALYREGIKTLEQLCSFSKSDLLKIGGFGRRSLNEVIDYLANIGLKLNTKPTQKVVATPDAWEAHEKLTPLEKEVKADEAIEGVVAHLVPQKSKDATSLSWVYVAKLLADNDFSDAAVWILKEKVKGTEQ